MKARISKFDVGSHDILKWPLWTVILLALAHVIFIFTGQGRY